MSSTFSNRDVKLGSTSGALYPFNDILGRFPASRKESRGPVGVAGRSGVVLKSLAMECGALLADIDKPLGSGGKKLSCGVRGDPRRNFSWTGLAAKNSVRRCFE